MRSEMNNNANGGKDMKAEGREARDNGDMKAEGRDNQDERPRPKMNAETKGTENVRRPPDRPARAPSSPASSAPRSRP